MIYFTEANIQHLSIHKVGNKQMGEGLALSEHPLEIEDEVLNGLLKQYFLAPFEKNNEVYRFTHATEEIGLNELYHFAAKMFEPEADFHDNTRQIAKQLYDITSHPNIKSGEMYVVYFKQLQIEGELLDAVGIFKSESKEPFLVVSQSGPEFEIGYKEEAINIKKLDKGCLIFNTEKEEGYKVAVIDQTNKTGAVYWVDEFLKLRIRNDDFNKTTATLSLCKSFVNDQLEEHFSMTKADKADLLNRSIQYFKQSESFNVDEFTQDVIGVPEAAGMFKSYKQQYEQDFGTPIEDSFTISSAAVKKQARVFKSVIKLDKNFHIYIHGNKDMIEQGYDDAVGRKYYKLYFEEEA